MGWWSHCWMRLGSGNGCCSGKRGRAGYSGLHGSGQKFSPKNWVHSFWIYLPWPPHGIKWGQVSLLFASRLPQKPWNSVLPLIISLSEYQPGRPQMFPDTPVVGLSSSLLEQDRRKRFGGSAMGLGNDGAGCWWNSLPGIQRQPRHVMTFCHLLNSN